MIKNEYYLEAEMKVQLPQDFHEKLLDLENQVVINSSLELIEELTSLYKLGAEFYSGISIIKQKHFSIKLKELYMDKKNLKILKQHYFNTTKNGYMYELSNDTTFSNIKNPIDIATDNIKIKRSKTFAKKDHFNPQKTFKRQTTITSKKVQSLSSFLNKNKLNLGTKKFLREKDTYFNEISEVKDVVNNFNNNLISCNDILEEEIEKQVCSFKDRLNKLKKRNSDVSTKRSGAKRHSAYHIGNNNEFISFLNTERKISQENVLTPRTKYSNMDMMVSAPVKAFNLSLKTQSKLLQYKRKSLSVNEIFEDFTNKFHYIFFQNLCEKFFKNSVTLLNENYIQKKEKYFKYEDQIKELKIMSADSDNYNDQFILMINELQSQRKLSLGELELDLKSDIQGLFKFLELAQNNEFQEKLSDIIDDLINNVMNIFK